ncbi:recombinase RecF [Clostridium algidicarnis]|uniref:ATP-binding protein n=1 Tax=Clostridium algidicarnis TaxID=37659 RepID=UPI001C0B7A2F|nr:ATP-binding protein [Clostridium algidicarnis]MBU3195690.1 recombinase RecF [Clostridium algidicarnis]
MKHIELKSLKLKNFKGIKDLKIDFSRVTNIYGENATGKTTIADSFMWLLFDKDSKDRSTFDIKTLDSNNQPIHGLEHEVTGTLNIDGKDIELSKIYKEKWTKKRGEAEKELTGHETLYSIDEVPVKKKEYQDKINNLIDENLFKLITNPLYFSTNMKWQDRRKSLLEVIGDLTDEEVINYKSDLKQLGELLAEKDIDTLKKSVQAKKRRLNDELKAIPIRIDEANNSIQDLDFEALEFEKRGIVSAVKSIEEQLLDSSKVSETMLKEKDKLYKLKDQLKDIEWTIKTDSDKPLQELKRNLYEAVSNLTMQKNDLNRAKGNISRANKRIEEKERFKASFKEDWYRENAKTFKFDESKSICPTCHRAFESDDIEAKKAEMEGNFNESKVKILNDISTQGKAIVEEIETLKKEIENNNFEELESLVVDATRTVDDIKKQIESFEPNLDLENNAEYQALKYKIMDLESKIQQPISLKNSDLKIKKYQLESELDEVNKKLNYKDTNGKLKQRMKELQEEERSLAQQIAQLEGQEYLCEEFIKAKVELLESSINSKFKFVSFKLFNTQVNGGIEETCEALIDGVPFGNANTASQINAGLDIINTLCSHYGVQAPIFIDNRESVNQLIETNSQVINLTVSKDKNLKVEVI